MRRIAQRGLTPIETAIGVAIFGSILAAALPAFFRELHASHFVEPIGGLDHIAQAATSYAESHGVPDAYPASAPLTPASVPHGTRVVDPPGTWEIPTWHALHFQPVSDGAPHAYAFAFTSTLATAASQGASGTAPPETTSRFVAEAHGDLDGDGVTSTFEVRGEAKPGEPAAITPGMYIQAELE